MWADAGQPLQKAQLYASFEFWTPAVMRCAKGVVPAELVPGIDDEPGRFGRFQGAQHREMINEAERNHRALEGFAPHVCLAQVSRPSLNNERGRFG